MQKIIDFLESFGINSAFLLSGLGALMLLGFLFFSSLNFGKIFGLAIAILPVVLPIILFFLFFEFWMYYIQKHYALRQGRVTLEIRIPEDIMKSPEAMELVITQLYQTASPDNHIQTYWDGKHPPTFGLEIVSNGGDVRLYMSVPRKKFKDVAETQLYAQYPGIEVVELPVDYAAAVPWDPDRFSVFGVHMGYKDDQVFPIKTYVDYGLTDLPKEEEKVDPITPMVDCAASMGPGEHLWFQILISAHRETTFKTGTLRKVSDWSKDVQKKIDEILQRDSATKRAPLELEGMPRISDGERDTVKAMERNLSKYPFDTGLRFMYIAEHDHFNFDRITAAIGAYRQFDAIGRNRIGVRWRTDYDWNWWQDPAGRRRQYLKKRELEHYKRRYYQRFGRIDGKKVMTVEELATMFHLPGRVALAPSLDRIPSARREAPPNLPTG